MQVLLTADGGVADLVYIDESMIDGIGDRIRQIVIDPQSLDDGIAVLLLVGEDFNSRDALDLLLERKSSDCRSLSQRVGWWKPKGWSLTFEHVGEGYIMRGITSADGLGRVGGFGGNT